ncbi:UDP-N-acetylmuramoyl-tripeptide--D-alanyl-D-alanine ligase [Aeromicrobium panaciterrae]|uniref:UDP-N-acetylmuramoyl-tripeptide--D-alanyl-D- alanine ligase n=1 Tax=Aeromicrobium panaciterrae TaxID=363861 RepID=UPI0031DAF2FA
MIPVDLDHVAEVAGGAVHGDGSRLVNSVVIDSRKAAAGALFAALAGEHVDGHEFAAAAIDAGATAILASRPLDVPCVVVDNVTDALAALARDNLTRTTAAVVGVTGSQGKTSVKDLLAHVLGASGPTIAPTGSFNNELGVPLTVLRADAATRFLVVEMGARGIGHIAELCDIASPSIGVVLNVGSAHIGEFGSAEAIAEAKGELVEALPADGTAVLNADDPLVSAMASRTRARVFTFGHAGELGLGDVSLDELGQPHFTLSHDATTVEVHVPQIGAHHAINAAAAAAAAMAAGLDLETIAVRLTSATATSPMRMEHHVRADGLVVINDAYNANPESMAAALRAVAGLGRGPVAVLGEMLELGDAAYDAHLQVGRLAAELGYARVVAVGPGAAAIAEGAGQVGEAVADVDTAVDLLSASLRADDLVVVKASRGARLERVAQALLAR